MLTNGPPILDPSDLTIEKIAKVMDDFKRANPRGHAETELLIALQKLPTEVLGMIADMARNGAFDGMERYGKAFKEAPDAR
jgi:hypothetical protein